MSVFYSIKINEQICYHCGRWYSFSKIKEKMIEMFLSFSLTVPIQK